MPASPGWAALSRPLLQRQRAARVPVQQAAWPEVLEGRLGRGGLRGSPLWQPILSHLNPNTSPVTRLQPYQ